MSQQPPSASPGGVEIYINGHVEGEGIAIGPGAQAHVVKNYYQAKISDTQYQRLVAEVKAEVLAQMGALGSAGFHPEVAPLPRRAEQVAIHDLFALPVGISPTPGRVAPEDAERWQSTFVPLNQRLQQLDQHLSAATPGERRVARELVIGQERVDLVDLLIQQGNLAVWAFRQASARLFADQVSAYYLAYPAWPTLPAIQAFHNEALRTVEVRRAWVLYQKYRVQHPEMTGPFVAQLQQGRWRDVLQAWLAAKEITAEGFHYERAYLKAIGERYEPQAVRAAAQQAETCFAEALRRQPDNSIALVNWGAIKAESALFFSIESGAIDRSRLQGAQALFNRAEGQLQQRQDRDGQIALGMSLLYDATCLPPDANLEAVQWAAQRTEHMRRDFPPEAAGAIQWEMVQRNWARRDARFFDEAKIKRARQILTAAGAAALLLLLEEWQTAHAAMLQQIAQWGGSGFGGQLPGQPPQPPVSPLKAGKAAQTLSRRAFLLRAGLGGGAVIVAGGAAIIAARAGVFSHLFGNATPTATPAPGATLATHRQNGGITGLAWSPAGALPLRGGASLAPREGSLRIASASQDGTVQVWDARTGKIITTYGGHKGAVLAVAWSPDGTKVASAGADRTVQMWDPATGNRLGFRNDLNQQIQALAWSLDSRQLAIGGSNGLAQVIDASGKLLFNLEAVGFQNISALDWSRDGQLIVGGGGYAPIGLAPGGGPGALSAQAASAAGLAAIWDSASGRSIRFYLGHAATVRAVAWSPNGTFVASGSEDTTVQIWRPGSKEAANTYKNHAGPINSVSWSPDAQRVVSGSDDQTAQVWEAATGASILTYRQHSAAVWAVAWSPDGQEIASGSDDQTAQVWKAP